MTQLQPVKIRLISLFDEELARKMSLDECSWSSVSHVLPCVSVYQWMFTPICERWTGAQACVCVCALPLHASWCVCVCVNKPLFVCGFGWRPLPLLLSEYGQVAVYVWMWHLCAVILLCGLPMLHWSKRLSLHHWHTLPWSWSHPHFLLFFNHPYCQLLLRFSASSKQYVKRVCLN